MIYVKVCTHYLDVRFNTLHKRDFLLLHTGLVQYFIILLCRLIFVESLSKPPLSANLFVDRS